MSDIFSSLYIPKPVTPRIFVSYHHGGDQAYYNELSQKVQSRYTLIYDNSLDRKIDSDNAEYVMRVIRQEYITGTSCTVVLCGYHTPLRKYVDWEIMATLQKEHALVGLWLPTLPQGVNGGTDKPARLQDNIDSGYAVWGHYSEALSRPGYLENLIHEARARPKNLIVNSRSRRNRNG